ncbi:hypothetical protein [Okeania sp. KiyG1]|uniref:hypothetical protein n=1 Tax=Okeania sp. KiyG1 TaxID=2720165 RepID=UPI0019238932|nr:hypothetical protein [Okeania sp. KiyG1]GGA53252.1 hypothetical protein CYANOKiyG1_73320 [Okeania sp. KiyG1]
MTQQKKDGVPILGWEDLLQAIRLLKNDEADSKKEIRYEYTWANFRRTLNPIEPTKIIDLPDGDDYQVIVNNKSKNSVYLYLGPDGDENLKVDNSAWEVKPGYGMTIEQSGCTLWAVAQTFSDIILTIHSTKPNSKSEVVIALNVDLKIGTGNLLGKDIPLFLFAEFGSDWEGILRSVVDSDQGITGNKAANLRSFQPAQTYEFTLVANPTFTDFRTGVTKPIQVFLIDFNIALSAMIAAVAGMRGNSYSALEKITQNMVGYAKSGGWIANLPPAGGAFSITPGNSQSYLVFCLLTGNGSETCVITDYDRSTNTFTLGGY